MNSGEAFGKPGISPKWTSSAKEGVGTSLRRCSRLHFTASHGIVNEVYYPGVDTAQIRDHQLLITDGKFFYEERRGTSHSIQWIKSGIPAYRIVNDDKDLRFKVEKTVFIDSENDVLVQHVVFIKNDQKDNISLYSLLSPHLMNGGMGNTAWNGNYKGRRMQFASKGEIFMAFYIPEVSGKMSCGFSGYSDGFQDIANNKTMTYEFSSATDGNVAITTEILLGKQNSFNMYTAFGTTMEEAALKVLKSSNLNWESALNDFVQHWVTYKKYTAKNILVKKKYDLLEPSLAVIRTHVSKEPLAGGIIASLSIPWGNFKGDDDLGGYHLIWPRDMVEAAQALLILGDIDGSVDALRYLQSTQESDGHWPQNMWLNGKQYWGGIQMDETAFPVVLLYNLWKGGYVKLENFSDMLIRALSFIVANGPVTDQDRWEEDGGYSSFTIAVEISALCYGSEMIDQLGFHEESNKTQLVADVYNSNIERWLYRENSDLDRKYGVNGHFVRISQVEEDIQSNDYIPIKNRPWSSSLVKTEETVSTGVLSLVRFGLRPHDHDGIINTVKIIDGELKTETKSGPIWHRYNHDGYGEHNDGTGFNGTGHGRGWPLLSGERAHYEISRGNMSEAIQLLHTMERDANVGGMIPEQIWDGDDIPERGLYNGRPSGSAMPLVWAHAEYVKLCWAIENGRPFERNEIAYSRYVERKIRINEDIWSFKNKIKRLKSKSSIMFILGDDCFVRLTGNNWKDMNDIHSRSMFSKVHYIEVDLTTIKTETQLEFTFFWKKSNRWEGMNYTVELL